MLVYKSDELVTSAMDTSMICIHACLMMMANLRRMELRKNTDVTATKI